jgi:hypothetical protein
MLMRKPVGATLSRTLFPSFADHRASCRHAAPLMTQPDCVYPGVVTPSRRKPPLRWRSACQPPGGSWPSHFRIEVIEDLLDDIGILDARDDPHRSAASRTGLDVDPENPLGALRPAHRGPAFGWRRLLRVRCRGMPASPAPPGRCHPRKVLSVRRKDPMEARQVDPRFRHQGRQPCDGGPEAREGSAAWPKAKPNHSALNEEHPFAALSTTFASVIIDRGAGEIATRGSAQATLRACTPALPSSRSSQRIAPSVMPAQKIDSIASSGLLGRPHGCRYREIA